MANLTATKIASIREPGRYVDGDGLMLVVGSSGARSWVLRVKYPGAAGRRVDIGLGSLKDVGLADARKRAGLIRQQVKNGEPVDKPWERSSHVVPTFKQAAVQLHRELLRSWSNGKHREQWLASLEKYAFPALGSRPVDTIQAGDVRDVLLNIWLDVPETARRVRQRIGAVLDWAHAKGFRHTEAPMRAVNRALPKQPRRDGHFAAMAYKEVPNFVAKVRTAESVSRRALLFLILTAARSGEVRGAKWSEVDLEKAIWTVPAARMKARRPHVVPLSSPALELLRTTPHLEGTELIFPGRDGKRALSDMTLTKLLRDMGVTATAHGFRSAFRDWAAEATAFPGEVAEAALAHTVPNKVEAAYRRTDFLDARRRLMEAWGNHLAQTPCDVVQLATFKAQFQPAA